MPPQARIPSGADSHVAARARQRLKLAGIGYFNARHGVDADEALAMAARNFLCKIAIEFAEALGLMNRRTDLYLQGDSEMLQITAIAYGAARHGSDADVGMTREGMATLCQAAIDFGESLPLKDEVAKRPAGMHFQLGNGVRP